MDTSIDPESELDVKQVKEIPIVQDTGTFKHDTGDVYDGYFEAKKKDRSVKMHGIYLIKSINNMYAMECKYINFIQSFIKFLLLNEQNMFTDIKIT